MSDQPASRNHPILLLVVCYGAAALLLLSNFTGAYDVVWKGLDEGVFRALNATIGAGKPLTQFWAWTNSKLFDEITFVVMLGLCAYLFFSAPREERLRVCGKLGAIILLILIALLISKQVFSDMPHRSPGYALAPFNNLNDFISGYTVKTASLNSFPGDHAMTSALFAGGLILLFRDRPYVIAFGLILMVFVCLPRLAGGGHWLTDVLVGGGAAALILLPWLKISPLTRWMEKLTAWAWRMTEIFVRR